MNLKLLSAILSILFAFQTAEAKEWPCTKFSKFPVLIDGCEGENCENIGNKVTKKVNVFAKPDSNSKIIGKLEKGDVIKMVEQKILLKRMGKFMVGKGGEDEKHWGVQELKKYGVQLGDTIYGVQYVGEGLYNHCIGDKVFSLDYAYGIEESEKSEEQLDTEQWAHIQFQKIDGWVTGYAWTDF